MLSDVGREAQTDLLRRHLFGADHRPVSVFKAAIRHKQMRGKFPTDKCRSSDIIRTRLPLMLDGLVHLEVNPDVLAIAPYPMAVDYMSAQGTEVVYRSHVPDVAVLLRDGTIVFNDFVPYYSQEDEPWIERRTRELQLHFEQFDAAYAVRDERSIHRQPRFGNYNQILEHKPTPFQHEGIAEACRAILRQPLPSTIGELSRVPGLKTMVGKWNDEPDSGYRVVPEVHVVFTACMQLAFRGEIRLDISHPFSPRTRVNLIGR